MRWTASLAYAIGLITSDGCLSKDGRHIEFCSKDLEQVENFKKILNLQNRITRKSSGFSDRKYYHVQFGSVVFYRFLLSIGLEPRKSKTLGKLLIPNGYFADFLRGCFDGDGCTFSYWDKRWKSSFLLYLSVASASFTFLRWLQNKISSLYGVNGKVGLSRSVFQLRYAKKDSLTLMSKMYYSSSIPFLKRKRFKIERALGIIQKQEDARVSKLVYEQP